MFEVVFVAQRQHTCVFNDDFSTSFFKSLSDLYHLQKYKNIRIP